MEQFRPIEECFERCDTIRAQHLLWEDALKERTDLTLHGNRLRYKMAFYMLLSGNKWRAISGKDKNGDFGYGLRFVPANTTEP